MPALKWPSIRMSGSHCSNEKPLTPSIAMPPAKPPREKPLSQAIDEVANDPSTHGLTHEQMLTALAQASAAAVGVTEKEKENKDDIVEQEEVSPRTPPRGYHRTGREVPLWILRSCFHRHPRVGEASSRAGAQKGSRS